MMILLIGVVLVMKHIRNSWQKDNAVLAVRHFTSCTLQTIQNASVIKVVCHVGSDAFKPRLHGL